MTNLLTHHWPGNVRELENVIKKIVVLENETLALAEINGTETFTPGNHYQRNDNKSSKISLKTVGKMAAREAERKLILETLAETRWNRRRTAELLEISYKALLYKIRDYKLEEDDKNHS